MVIYIYIDTHISVAILAQALPSRLRATNQLRDPFCGICYPPLGYLFVRVAGCAMTDPSAEAAMAAAVSMASLTPPSAIQAGFAWICEYCVHAIGEKLNLANDNYCGQCGTNRFTGEVKDRMLYAAQQDLIKRHNDRLREERRREGSRARSQRDRSMSQPKANEPRRGKSAHAKGRWGSQDPADWGSQQYYGNRHYQMCRQNFEAWQHNHGFTLYTSYTM